MEQNRPVMIVENSDSRLQLVTESNNSKNKYSMSGTFTEFDIENRNKRIYNAQQFMPHLDEMLERKKMFGVVYGEYDHPDVFDTSLSRVSHIIESAIYNKEQNRIDGSIKLLNNFWGKEARALVDEELPIFVSSRAAGVTEGNGNVVVKKLFTYDIVADPGFASTRMNLDSLHESATYDDMYKESNFRLYDVTNESKFNELIMDNKNNEFVTKFQMNDYSDYITNEINNLKESITKNATTGELPATKLQEMVSFYETLQEQQEKIKMYLDYLTENVNSMSTINTDLISKTDKLEEKANSLEDDNKKINEKVDKCVNYTEYIAETLDSHIDFTDYIAENVEKNIAYSDYLGESIQRTIDYSNYVKENVDNLIAYSEYIAESTDENILKIDNIKSDVKNVVEYSNYLAENLDNNIAYTEYVCEHADNLIAYTEYVSENVSDTQAYQNYLAESLDKTIEAIKNGKVNEAVQMPEYKTDNVQRFYNDQSQAQPNINSVQDQDGVQPTQAQDGVQPPVQPPVQDGVQPPVQNPVVETPIQDIQTQVPQIDTELPIQQDVDITGVPDTASVEDQSVMNTEIVPGMTIDVEGKGAVVLSYNPENGIATVQMNDAEEGEISEVAYESIKIKGTDVLKENKDIKSYVSGLISDAIKRKAEDEKEPHFLTFLPESKKSAYNELTESDKNKVKVSFLGKSYFSSSEVMNIMTEAITPVYTFEDRLISNIPPAQVELFEGLDTETKNSLVATAKLYPNLDSDEKMEYFWESRKLENYTLIQETKQEVTLNENKVMDDSSLDEEQIERFFKTLKELNS